MKRLIAFFLFSIPMMVSAQKTHTVAAKESFYSLGRLYNVHPKDLATYNNIPFEKGLSIGQVIKIPAASNAAPMPVLPATATETPKATPIVIKEVPKAKPSTGSAPVYHTVAAKEGLYGISKKYNVAIAEIKKWNNLSSDGLTIGSNLIVGYNGAAPAFTEQPKVTRPVTEVKNPVTKTEAPVVIQEQPKPVIRESVAEKGPANFNGGYFKAFYNQQVKEKSAGMQDKGSAGIFKSTSGWDDGKYYCLHNSAAAGSFVKITNTANNKSVYAKVLDLIPDLKQNTGIIIRISNAAASELGVSGSNFDCILNY
ncbi:MAG: LysM peptidoglycan-binding domain-containing protein [Rhizobacter sp.]|nr:LysM peptidoglycan-binding domain-containing protein [Ferruginibacter sp.]